MTQRRIYQCAFPYFITFNVLNKERLFDDQKKAEALYEIILQAGELKCHKVYQFCIMPDHVHILCKTTDSSHRRLENLRFDGMMDCGTVGFPTRGDTISDFIKSVRGTFSRQIHRGQIWHPRFYDRIIQNEQQLEIIIHYITQNPIKAGLPEKWQHHPYQYNNIIAG
jgi:putative transposase